MSTILPDTLAIAQRCRAAGFTDAQVEVVVETARQISSVVRTTQVPTKAELQAEFAKFKSELLMWLIGVTIGINGFTIMIFSLALRR